MSIIGDILGAIQHEEDKNFNEHQATLNRMFQHNEAQLAYERELSADSTKYQRQVQDMTAAGLNPMMAVSAGAGSVHSSPAAGALATAPGASGFSGIGSLSELIRVKIEKQLADAEIALKGAQKSKIESETTGLNIDNEVKELTKSSAIESASLRNQLDRAKVREIDGKLDEIESNIKKMAAETETEAEKKFYYTASALLASARASQVVELLPYEKALKAATTENQRAAAALAAAHTAYQNHLIDDGYLDAFIRKATAEAGSAEDKQEIDDIKAAMRTGDWSKVNSHLNQPLSVTKQVIGVMTNMLENLNPLNNMFK